MRDPIRIETKNAALVFQVDEDGHLMQVAFGASDAPLGEGQVAYPAFGDGWVYEPAIRVVHADGNRSLDLRFDSVGSDSFSDIPNLTRIKLKDPEYPFWVYLNFRPYPEQDVIEAWTEILHEEEGEVLLEAFAASAPDFGPEEFWLTQFRGDWNDEAHMDEEKLGYGLKILDSKLIVRAHQFRAPWFLLSKGGPAQEDEGEVFGGSLAWPGSFQFAFEKLPQGRLRAICGVNPYASSYSLPPKTWFIEGRMVWGYSAKGTGQLSRNLQAWVRENVIREGNHPRAILLNNWEATYFDFDEAKIISLFDGAKSLGMELFLLDDGWFGEKYPRDGDHQGLGDWKPDPKKLPNGVQALADAAQERGLRFGIWIEPEMVNPKSELFEENPDFAIQQPKRKLELQRNQLVLDLSHTAVVIYHVIRDLLNSSPGISYLKWDCNRYVTQPGSTSLSATEQPSLAIEYVQNLRMVLGWVADNYPNVEIMMCSGGGGRVDYGSMQYAHELWPSDNTDPVRRIFIQWGYSHFFPAIAVSAHVTNMSHRPLKFAFDVAMSGRLGMDMDVDKLSTDDRAFSALAIETYKGIRTVVQLGEQYRLESPYAGPRSSLMYVEGDRAVVFVYSLGDAPAAPLSLKGLDADRSYRVRELNLADGSGLETTMQGSEALPLPAYSEFGSGVFELTAI